MIDRNFALISLAALALSATGCFDRRYVVHPKRPLVLSGLTITQNGPTASVSFGTGDMVNTSIEFWPEGKLDQKRIAGNFRLNGPYHGEELRHLEPSTVYRYRVLAKDRETGKLVDLTPEPGRFETGPLLVSEPILTVPGREDVSFKWTSAVPTTARIEISSIDGPEKQPRPPQGGVVQSSRPATTHSTSCGGLTPGSRYLFQIYAKTPDGQWSYNPSSVAFTTLP